VDTEDARKGRVGVSQADESSSRASLQLELRVPDKQMLTVFRDAFLRWLTHRTGPFGRAIGFGDRLSVDEVAPTSDAQGMSTLRLTVTWSPSKSTALARVNSLRTVGGLRTVPPRQASPESFVFVQCPTLADAPLHPELSEDESAGPVLEPYPRLSRRRRESRMGARAARAFAAAMTDLRGRAQESIRGLSVDRLTLRAPTLATHPRVWTFGLLASAAVATGFVVGSVYLGSSNRPSVAAAPPVSQADATTSAPASPAVAETIPAPVTAAVDVPPTAKPTLVASADPEPQAVRPRPQPVERRTLASDRSQKSARKDTALARPGRNAQGAPAPAVATTGAAVPGDEVITSATLPDNGLVRSAATRPVPAAVVRVVDGGSVPTVGRRIKGTLLVKSDPQGAEVSINGVVQGRTPLVIRDLGAGSRVVRLELPGYERWSWAVAVVANKRTPVTVKLRPESRGVGNPD
jgi:PEGA domain